jgi:cytochrome c oxidase subunit II
MSRAVTCGVIVSAFFVIIFCVGAIISIDFAARSDFPERWLDRWAESASVRVDINTDDPVERGEAIYRRNCSGCHSLDGSQRVGPTLRGLYGSEVKLSDGTTVIVDEEHIRVSITDPSAMTRDGFRDMMPTFDRLSHRDIESLVAFIRSLE